VRKGKLLAMLEAAEIDGATRDTLITRLKSIEGQARGIQRMLEEGRDCQAIIDQLAALRAASHAATMQALQRFAANCMKAEPPEVVLAHFTDIMAKLTR
jgi:CsoR family transcriptional regulator, copper-sensing transcriptional repressor